MIRIALVAVAVAALLAGCGGSGAGHGTATLWVTRDEGATVLVVRSVPADETVLQALERSTKITTHYGGRFVQSVNGISGSITSRHDWFYFVNGSKAIAAPATTGCGRATSLVGLSRLGQARDERSRRRRRVSRAVRARLRRQART